MIDELVKSFYIAMKDFREYYMKPGALSWGLLFPFVFALAFMIRRGGLTEWLAPGMITLALFFGSTSMSAMSIVFERRLGSFERLMLYPVNYTTIALGKTLSSFLMGIVSIIPVLILVMTILRTAPAHPFLLALATVLATFESSTFGVLLSFMVKDPTQVMVVFNLVRFPMMFLADVIVPVSLMPHYALPVVLLQPLTYSAEVVRFGYEGSFDILPPEISFVLTFIIGVFFLVLAGYIIKRSKP